jgi:hypothetical protein
MGKVLALVVLAGCGRLSFDPLGLSDGSVGDTTTVDGDFTTCSAPFSLFEGECIHPVATPTDWLSAERACEAERSHLFVAKDVPTHFVVHDALTAASIVEAWIGFSDRVTEGTFAWVGAGGVNPATDMCFFGSGGPVNGNNQDCVSQTAANACPDWTVRDCLLAQPYICERDGHVPDPTAY